MPRNVARLVVVPIPPRHEVQPLTSEQARQLLTTARDDRLYALWAVAVAVGLRRGEALGLRRADVDLDIGVLQVRQTLQRIDGGLRLVPPKTARSRRTIPLPAVTLAALKTHRTRMEGEAVERGVELGPADFVFASTVGTPLEPRNVNRAFYALLDRAGLGHVRLHDLRHTCASLLLAQGVPARVVMETLGHSAIAVTMNTYSHVLPSLQREAADRMDDVLR